MSCRPRQWAHLWCFFHLYTYYMLSLYRAIYGKSRKLFSVNFASLKHDKQKSALLKEVEKYGYTVLDMTFDELEEQGYIEDLYFKEGILFKLEDKPMSGSSITMDASKWRSGLGAIGYNDLEVKYKSGRWVITKAGSAWIS